MSEEIRVEGDDPRKRPSSGSRRREFATHVVTCVVVNAFLVAILVRDRGVVLADVGPGGWGIASPCTPPRSSSGRSPRPEINGRCTATAHRPRRPDPSTAAVARGPGPRGMTPWGARLGGMTTRPPPPHRTLTQAHPGFHHGQLVVDSSEVQLVLGDPVLPLVVLPAADVRAELRENGGVLALTPQRGPAPATTSCWRTGR